MSLVQEYKVGVRVGCGVEHAKRVCLRFEGCTRRRKITVIWKKYHIKYGACCYFIYRCVFI